MYAYKIAGKKVFKCDILSSMCAHKFNGKIYIINIL